MGARIPTSIKTEFQAGSLQGTGTIRNLSTGGLFVGTQAIPEQGDTVELAFSLPGRARVEVKGMVWWTTTDPGAGRCRTPGFGLCVLDETDDWRGVVDAMLP